MGIFLSLRAGSVGSTGNGLMVVTVVTVVPVVPVATVPMVVTNDPQRSRNALTTVFNRIVWTATAKL